MLPLADVVFGTPNFDAYFTRYDHTEFRRAASALIKEFPNLDIVISTLRAIKSASRHDFSAVCLADSQVIKARDYVDLNVFDRVGSGDAFAAGFIYGVLRANGAPFAVECGTAHAVLAMTTPGDNSTATLNETAIELRTRRDPEPMF